jgi:hypothetical protein
VIATITPSRDDHHATHRTRARALSIHNSLDEMRGRVIFLRAITIGPEAVAPLRPFFFSLIELGFV